MSEITDKIQRLITENNGELNGIQNAALFMEILTDLEAAATGGGSSPSGAFKMQGDYDFTATGEFPTAADCADDLTVDDGIPKGYAWRVIEKYGDYSINDIIVAKVDNAINNSEQWDVLEGNIGNSPNLIATAYAIDGDSIGTSFFSFSDGKSLATHFITHFVVKAVSGSAGGAGAGFKINIDGNALLEDVATGASVSGKNSVWIIGSKDFGTNISFDPESEVSFEVTSTNGGAIEYNVYLYGLPY